MEVVIRRGRKGPGCLEQMEKISPGRAGSAVYPVNPFHPGYNVVPLIAHRNSSNSAA
jgi:hypothetical protein